MPVPGAGAPSPPGPRGPFVPAARAPAAPAEQEWWGDGEISEVAGGASHLEAMAGGEAAREDMAALQVLTFGGGRNSSTGRATPRTRSARS